MGRHAASKCRRFSVTHGGPISQESKFELYFHAYARSMTTDPEFHRWGVIGLFDSMKEAQAACEQHAVHVYRDTA